MVKSVHWQYFDLSIKKFPSKWWSSAVSHHSLYSFLPTDRYAFHMVLDLLMKKKVEEVK